MTENQELFDAIESEPQEIVDLTVVRNMAVHLRDSYLEKAEVEEKLKVIQSKISNIERKELPHLFSQAKISSVTVEHDGNHPGFVAERKTVYGAAIPDDKRIDAFEWFNQQGHGDLVKAVIEITFGMQEEERRLEVMKLLSDHHVEYSVEENIHHMTLKAFVKRELTAGRIIPMDLLGAFIFDEVKIKEDKT